MKIIADTHTHTLASGHAYSTILENDHAAKAAGLSFLCLTEHCPEMWDAPKVSFFSNLHSIPDVVDDVVVLKGAEVNILDYEGGVDLPPGLLKRLDWVIASYHGPVCPPGTLKQHTDGWIKIAQNPDVDVIGHCGDGRYLFELDKVVRAFKEFGKIVEINAHSFSVRTGAAFNCRQIAECCMKFEVPVVVSSDAHFCLDVGNVKQAVRLLEEIGFPERLVLNADYDRFLEVARQKTGRRLIARDES